MLPLAMTLYGFAGNTVHTGTANGDAVAQIGACRRAGLGRRRPWRAVAPRRTTAISVDVMGTPAPNGSAWLTVILKCVGTDDAPRASEGNEAHATEADAHDRVMEQILARIAEQNFAEEFEAKGLPYVELDEDGQVVRRTPGHYPPRPEQAS